MLTCETTRKVKNKKLHHMFITDVKCCIKNSENESLHQWLEPLVCQSGTHLQIASIILVYVVEN